MSIVELNALSPDELRKWIKTELYVAVVCDVLDELGYREQAMHQRLRPLLPDRRNCGFVGRASTVQWMPVEYVDTANPYGLEIEAIDALERGDVVVHSTDYAGTNAPWGELMSTAAQVKGVAGCICDSQIRDCVRIIEMGFPIYYTGIRPLDSQGRARVMAYDVPIRCGEVRVHPGDLVFADFDGIVVIPQRVEEETLRQAYEKVNKESMTRRELLQGRSLREVYDKYGVL
jgi:regulator of RNase E activity RraA